MSDNLKNEKKEVKEISVSSFSNAFLSMISWIIGITFFVFGLFLLFDNFLSGIILIVVSGAFLPPVKKIIKEKYGYVISNGVKFILIIICLVLIPFLNSDKENSEQNKNIISDVKTVGEDVLIQNKEESIKEEEKIQETLGQKNSKKTAKSYIDIKMGFSRSGLIKQLEFEGYSTEDAVYAIDSISPDWNIQAELKAKSYLDVGGFSRSGIIKQLEFEGFTQEQIDYAIGAVGY